MADNNQQAYTGMAGLGDTTSEWNRMQFAIRAVTGGMATMTLVMVRAVGPGDTVDVQPMVAQTDGVGNAVAHGIIHGLPIWRLQGGTSGVIVVPAVGDIGLAVFAHSDISGVKRAKAPTTPGSARKFDYSDGIFLGGVLNVPATQFVRLDSAGIAITSPVAVTITAPTISTMGTLTNNGHAVGSTHMHGSVQTGTGTSGPPV